MKGFLFLIAALLICSCQSLPVMSTLHIIDDKDLSECPAPFLKQKSQLVHAIETRMPGNIRSTVIGVTKIDPVTRVIACAILTAEGMVLFEAESDRDGISIHRALPPFDSGTLAQNMLADIELIFLAPLGQFHNRGFLANGAHACRYRNKDGGWTDVIGHKTADIQIKRYTSSGAIKRHVHFSNSENIYSHIELKADETLNYSLTMTLIEIRPDDNNFK